MKNFSDGCKQHFTSNLHCGLDAHFANGLQNGVISHVHPSWNNGFVSGQPSLPIEHCFLFLINKFIVKL